METFEWLAPQPLWGSLDMSDVAAVRGPVIAKFKSDSFMDQFLAATRNEAVADLTTTVAGERLYLPFHASYHLVLASLVCNRLGFPDRALDAATGESVGFVLRKRGPSPTTESAWLPTKGWVALSDVLVTASVDGVEEEVFPLIRATVGGRALWHGFVPLASSESIDGASKFRAKPGAEQFVLRCVYRRPHCKTTAVLVSEPSPAFRVSTFLDPTAPQRQVEISLDLNTIKDLGRPVTFKLGSAVEAAVSAVRSKVLDELPAGVEMPDGAECSTPGFSIPWITLVAFILLMIITALLWPIAVTLQFLLPKGQCNSDLWPAPEDN